MKLLDVVPAKDKIHKYKAVFLQDNGRKKTVSFGAFGMMDYTIYSKEDKDLAEEHKRLYLERHEKKEDWTNPMTAGALSRWILWHLPTLQDSLEDFRKRFQLQAS